MGRASDLVPITISNVVARKCKDPVPTIKAFRRIAKSPEDIENKGPATKPAGDDEYGITVATADPVGIPHDSGFIYVLNYRTIGHGIQQNSG